MLLRAPINADKPLIRHGWIILLWMHGARYDKAHGSLSSLFRVSLCDDLPSVSLGPVRVLGAQLPTRGIPRFFRLHACPFPALLVPGFWGTTIGMYVKV